MLQVAEVVQQVLRLADESVLIEAWASPDSPAVQLEEAIAEVFPPLAPYSPGFQLVKA